MPVSDNLDRSRRTSGLLLLVFLLRYRSTMTCQRTSVDDFRVRSQSLPVTEISEISFETGDKCFALSIYDK